MSTIALFDIDKTLVNGSKAHWDAFFFALKDVYNVRVEPGIIAHHGMTDQQIIREVLKIKGLSSATSEAGLSRCMQVMVDKFNELNPADTVELLPGVAELLTALAGRGARCGLVTGNLEAIAWPKLAKAGIDRHFTFGGFGSDHEDRKKMADLAVRRCCGMYNLDIKDCRVVLFGDTPYDIAAARAIHAFAVGVATGYPTREQLAAAGADIVLDNLADTEKVLALIFMPKTNQGPEP